MTGVKVDGTNCGASMVKTNVDCPREAPPCQRISSMPLQISFIRVRRWTVAADCFPSARLCDKKLLTLPLADPGPPSVISKRAESTLRHERVNLRADGCCLGGP